MMCLRILIFVCLGVLITGRRQVGERHMIVVSMPGTSQDSVYGDYSAAIAKFIRDLSAAAVGYDDLAIVYDATSEGLFDFTNTSAYTCKIDSGMDLWMRDFSPVVDDVQARFWYEPSYLRRGDIRFVNRGMRKFYNLIGVSRPQSSDLALDGGNLIENGVDKAVVTRRVNRENIGWGYFDTEAEIVDEIEDQTGRTVALVADPGDTTGHIDGVMAFTDVDKAVAPGCFWNWVAKPVLAKFPSLNIASLPCPPDSGATGTGFTSADLVYANALVTYNSIYVPSFSSPATDSEAYNTYYAHSDQPNVVSIDTVNISNLGGGVRCMTWSMQGDMPVAKAIRRKCAQPTRPN